MEVCVFGYPEIFGLESYYDNQKYLGRVECISSKGSVYQIAITDLSLRLNNSTNKNLLKKMATT